MADILSSWSNRIRFAFVLGISTSADLFQLKLSRAAIRCLEAQKFHIDPVDIEVFFRAIHHGPTKFMLGPGLSQSLLDRQQDNIQNPSSMVQSLKVGCRFPNVTLNAERSIVCTHDTGFLRFFKCMARS